MKPNFLINRITVLVPIFILFFCTIQVFASGLNVAGTGDNDLNIIMESKAKAMIKMFHVNDETNQVDIVTNKEITSIQVIDDQGEVIFFLPVVGSDELNVGTSLFESGTYYINMGFEGESSQLMARVEKK